MNENRFLRLAICFALVLAFPAGAVSFAGSGSDDDILYVSIEKTGSYYYVYIRNATAITAIDLGIYKPTGAYLIEPMNGFRDDYDHKYKNYQLLYKAGAGIGFTAPFKVAIGEFILEDSVIPKLGYVAATGTRGGASVQVEAVIDGGGMDAGDFAPVDRIEAGPSKAGLGIPLTLSGVPVPMYANNQTIAWSVKSTGGTGAEIIDGALHTTSSGTAVVTATIANGKGEGVPCVQDFSVDVSYVPVVHMQDVVASAGTAPYPVSINIPVSTPNGAYNGCLVHIKVERGMDQLQMYGTGADTAPMRFLRSLSLPFGSSSYSDYNSNKDIWTCGFLCNVVRNPIEATSMTVGRLEFIYVGDEPVKITLLDMDIVRVVDFSGDHIILANCELEPIAPPVLGINIRRASGPEGFVSATDISGMPSTATAWVPLTLTGTVAPADATNKNILWAVKDAGTTGATIVNGNGMNTTAEGAAVLTATIVDGRGTSVDFVKDFTITVDPAFRYGDVDGNGRVAPMDATLLSRYLAGWPGILINMAATDVDGDGEVTPYDLAILQRHIAGWPGYETLPYQR
ncbi:MAG: dockerin type I domain-containing protein [Clostridiales bacterium]|nr:dockerin type I domain-containing protein [Clostridiales bacterium]